jgi:hypothetical protein
VQVFAAGFPSLAWLLAQRPRQGTPVLLAGARYFFRRAVEDDAKLFQGLAFARLEGLGEAQEQGFASLSAALTQQGERLEELLGGVQAVVAQTHGAVLDLQGQMRGQGEQIGQIGQAVLQLLEQYRLQRREVRPGDSLSIRDEGERQLVKQLVARYRSLPEGERRNVPALLNAIGKLEVVAGDFDQAQRDFQQVATMVGDTRAKAEAHFNAYQAALERRDFGAALKDLIGAVKLDAKRYAPFPVGKYHPLRILGAGGFGTAFLCRHRYMNADVVVKALHLEALGRDTDRVFTEAQVLRQLDHPAIIRISECGYVDAAGKGRPHLIMDYFQGQTLESYVKEHGPLSVEDVLAVARQVAEGLQAAHGAKVLHRDVKPANLLVRKEAAGWKVKIIDFGLALPQKVVETSRKGSTARQKETMVGSSIAGTVDYGAPEQMGRRKEPVGPYSDVYGWAKTCCYALFRTTQSLPKHWQSVPGPLAGLLGQCLEEDPADRPASCAAVLRQLNALGLRQSGPQGAGGEAPSHAGGSVRAGGGRPVVTAETEPVLGVHPIDGEPAEAPPSCSKPEVAPREGAGAGTRPSAGARSRAVPAWLSPGGEPARGAPEGRQPAELRHALFLKRLKELARLPGRTASIFLYLGVGALWAITGFFVGFDLGVLTCEAFGHSDLGIYLGAAVGIIAGLSLAVGVPAVLRWRDVRAAHVAAEQIAREYPTELQPWGGASVLRDDLAVQELIRFLDKGGAGPAVPPDGQGAEGRGRAGGVLQRPGSPCGPSRASCSATRPSAWWT